jgi:hypothetical protein
MKRQDWKKDLARTGRTGAVITAAALAICACSPRKESSRTTVGAADAAPSWELGWAPATLRLLSVTKAQSSLSLGYTEKLATDPCFARLRERLRTEVTLSPIEGKSVVAFSGDLDRSAIEACARTVVPFVSKVTVAGELTMIEAMDGKRLQLWFATPSWVVVGSEAEIAALRTGPRLAPDSTLAKQYAASTGAEGHGATTLPLADRLLGVTSLGMRWRITPPKIAISVAYPDSVAASEALGRLRAKQFAVPLTPLYADALGATPTTLDGTSVVLSIDLAAPPWSALTQEDTAELTRRLSALVDAP